jgi:putative flippase GtrA
VTDEQPTKRSRMKRVGKFGAVGAANTLLDFVLYNILSSGFRLSLVEANIISTTVAMVFSFTANKKLVFKKHDGSIARQALMFYAVTAFGLYVLQSATIHFLTEIWLTPVNTIVASFIWAGVTGHDQFLIKNSAKAVATFISLSWNYVMYKKVVFR